MEEVLRCRGDGGASPEQPAPVEIPMPRRSSQPPLYREAAGPPLGRLKPPRVAAQPANRTAACTLRLTRHYLRSSKRLVCVCVLIESAVVPSPPLPRGLADAAKGRGG